MSVDPKLIERVTSAFRVRFGGEPELLVQAPGRVNLIGEHTDYNDGFVLPCAIDRHTVIAARRRADGGVAVTAADYGDAFDRFTVNIPIDRAEYQWANYVRGVASVLRAQFALPGIEMAIAGDVPQGAGLSSSASLEVAVAHVFKALTPLDLNPTEIALVAQRAENEFVGCACGIMDQLVSVRAEAGHALLIDCRSLETRPVPIPEGLTVLIIHSRVARGLVDSAYNERRGQCETAAQHCGVAALRDLDLPALELGRAGLDPIVFRRARHVVTENARTLAAAEALAAGDLAGLGRLMADSHMSMRNDFEITVPPIDRIVEIVQDAIGSEGAARMTGGGFGGCVVALAQEARVAAVRAAVERDYRAPKGESAEILICKPSAGAGPL